MVYYSSIKSRKLILIPSLVLVVHFLIQTIYICFIIHQKIYICFIAIILNQLRASFAIIKNKYINKQKHTFFFLMNSKAYFCPLTLSSLLTATGTVCWKRLQKWRLLWQDTKKNKPPNGLGKCTAVSRSIIVDVVKFRASTHVTASILFFSILWMDYSPVQFIITMGPGPHGLLSMRSLYCNDPLFIYLFISFIKYIYI